MSFVGDDHVFYKESFRVNRTGQLVNRKNSPCTIAILNEEVTVFRYILTDPCVLAGEKNLDEVGYKFYAGAPLVTRDGFKIGILAVVDRSPRVYSDMELENLKQLAGEVMTEIGHRLESKLNHNIRDLNNRLKVLHKRVDALRRAC